MNYADAGYIYAIRNTVNGNAYIGSTTNYKSRWFTHKSLLRKGKHHSFILQRAWDKYGEAAFAVIREDGMSTATYYKYVKMLGKGAVV